MISTDFRLLEQRRDQSVGNAAVTNTFADGVDARVEGLQRIVDKNTAIAG